MVTYYANSSLIHKIIYDELEYTLTIIFHRQDWQHDCTFIHVPQRVFDEFIEAESKGNFYLNYIKPIFKIKKTSNMADKIIKLKIDVTKLKKEWFFKGEKGIYADVTVLYNEKPDSYGQNGIIIQDVPKAIYTQDKNVRGPILGNCKDWATQQDRPAEATPGVESGTMIGVGETEEYKDDLPF